MAITYFREVFAGRSGSRDQLYSRYTRVWQARTDNAFQAAASILEHPDLPEIDVATYETSLGDESDEHALLTKLEPRQHDDNPYLWTIVGDYSEEASDPMKAKNPLDLPPEINYTNGILTKALINHPTTGARLTNTAGDPFMPPPTYEVIYKVLTYVKNLSEYDSTFYASFENHVNRSEWKGYARGHAFCKSISPQRLYHKRTPYARVTFVFWLRVDEDWHIRLLNIGKRYVDEASGLVVPATLQSGHLNADGILLDLNGHPLPDGLDPVYVEVERPDQDFNTLTEVGDIEVLP